MRASLVLDSSQAVARVSLAKDPSILLRSDCEVFLVSVVYDFKDGRATTLPNILYIRLDSGLRASPATVAQRIHEINMYKLLESKLPVSIPAYCFGDVCETSRRFFLATACVPGVHVETLDFLSGEHLESFDDTNLEHCRAAIRVGGGIAKKYILDSSGSTDFLRNNFRDDSVADQPVEKASAEPLGLVLVRCVAEFQKITVGSAKRFLPADLTTPEALKLFRYAISASRKHQALLSWFLAMCPCFSFDELRGAVVHGLTNVELGSCEFTGLSIAPIGAKLWSWLGCLPYDTLSHHVDDLLVCLLESCASDNSDATSARTYEALGGIIGSHGFDAKSTLYMNFVVASVVNSCHILDSEFLDVATNNPETIVDAIKACAESHSNMRSNMEKRVAPLLNLLTLLVRSGAKLVLDKSIQLSSACVGLGSFSSVVQNAQSTLRRMQVIYNKAEVRESVDDSSSLICILPLGSLVEYVLEEKPYRSDVETSKAARFCLTNPVYGWIDINHLAPVPQFEDEKDMDLNLPWPWRTIDWKRLSFSIGPWQRAVTRHVFFALFHHVRLTFVKEKQPSLGFCGFCSQWALEALNACIETGAFVHYDNGETFSPWTKWRVVNGGFSKRESPTVVLTHSYLVCDDDGSIADITADQFGKEYPQIWWPADPARYSATTQGMTKKITFPNPSHH